ncbi:MAG TPA: hypothetical protein VGS22_13700 [Thermoanaerobaculia bacterium]|jgi:hypothetical protein|nr:hypothetical protein [Thermoanaerobaculia bacterium]
MSAILIHRCRLRLVRRDGWSWGADPRALLEAALRALPALLAAALEGLWPEGEQREIAAPVRLRLGLRAAELTAVHAGFSGGAPPPAGSPAAELSRRLAAALAVALASELRPTGVGGEGSAPEGTDRPRLRIGVSGAASDDPVGTGEAPPSPQGAAALAALLRSWRERGTLLDRLALLSEATLVAWAGVLAGEEGEVHDGKDRRDLKDGTDEKDIEDGEDLGGVAGAEGLGASTPNRVMALHLWRGAGDRAAALRSWLVHFVETAAHGGAVPVPQAGAQDIALASPGAMARAALEAASQGAAARVAQPGGVSLPVRAPAALGSRLAAEPPSPRPMPWRDAEVQALALPFLLLGPLSRTGYLETLVASLAAAGLAADLPLFAAALAFKALPVPERGWRRTPLATGTAAACAGLLDPVAGEQISGLARRAAVFLEPLAADLAASIVAGHEAGRPLLLAAAGEGLLLAEADGVFPVAWAPSFDGLRPVLARLRDETLLVGATSATPALLREIDAGGCRFVTRFSAGAQPTRGEPWQPLRSGGRDRLWTNDPAAPGLARQAAGLTAAEEGARRLWQALAVERPSAPAAADPALDRHLTLAAGVALGALAWTLWRDRETVDPVLALERFGDLTARVKFGADAVRVLLPLGRRHRDLSAHGLLKPVRDAVWLGGRTLEFGGG